MSDIYAYNQWRTEREADLRRPDGWLSLIGLFWLDDGRHSVGADAAAGIQLPAGPGHLGILEIEGLHAQWLPTEGGKLALQSDSGGKPTVVICGHLSFFLIERDGRLALRLRDSKAPALRSFHGIECFGFDPGWQIQATWDGTFARFARDGVECSLRAEHRDEGMLQFVFADQTSGRQTYGGGRFLFVPVPDNDRLVLDFNRAVNPPCSFTPFAVCPLPPTENRLPLPVTAGEKIYRA